LGKNPGANLLIQVSGSASLRQVPDRTSKMVNAAKDPLNIVDDYQLISQGQGLFLQHHTPDVMGEVSHLHPSIEVNYLQGCEIDYAFGDRIASVPAGRFCVFLAAQPHRVVEVRGTGKTTNAYISFEEFWSWPLPRNFFEAILAAGVAIATETLPGDNALAERLARETSTDSEQMNRLHCLELQARITRLALSGWDLVAPARDETRGVPLGGNGIAHFERMLRFIAINYKNPITLSDVASATSISDNYANNLFKRIIGTTVKAHIIRVRVDRARILLSKTDAKIISVSMDSGFRSLSSFYDAFDKLIGVSPAAFRRKIGKSALS